MSNYLKQIWMSISIQKKIKVFVLMVVVTVMLSAAFNIFVSDFVINGCSSILNDNFSTHVFQQSIENETEVFEAYIRNNECDVEMLHDAIHKTEQSIQNLPFQYAQIGSERYAITWSILNGYESYSKKRDLVLSMDGNREFVEQLYKVYGMQKYLNEYAKRLVQETLADGNDTYQKQAVYIKRLPLFIIIAAVFMVTLVLYAASIMKRAIIDPIAKMVSVSKKISVNDYSGEDVEVDNHDEMGELVLVYNKMKHATEGYINALQEKQEMMELLHRDEVEKMEMEKHLRETQMELLKSQINPHFLFNTLNIIACTAKIEEAKSTEQMIVCLGNLFRYNLKTQAGIVPLEQELKIVKDYMYIQRTRFGSRIRYDVDCRVNEIKTIIPALIMQPIVENAVIHGIAKKEQGGRIHIKIWENEGAVMISVADTGQGISEERMEELKSGIEEGKTAKAGIGMGNVYKRIQTMYKAGDFKIFSKYGTGTIIQIKIPEGEMLDVQDTYR